MSGDLDVVYFAGAGGSSEAYRIALGKHPDVALNHSATALAVHQRNFPKTEHLVADVFDVDPRSIRPGQKWRSFWASPDCRHFSKAKGGAPVSPRVRGLAWVVVKVAALLGPLKPDVIFLENVEEFQDWGPLTTDDKGRTVPDAARKGQTFRLWVKRLEQCGYRVEWKELVAADYGAPTIRKRLFVIARCDGQPITWPAPTHAPRKVAAARGLKPWAPAADVIDWSLPCPSIFLSPAEVKVQGLRCKRPLEEATLRRIARGVERYVIGAAEPFIVPVTHRGDDRVHASSNPLRTVTTASRGEFAVCAPLLVGAAYGDNRPGAGLRAWSAEEPTRVVTSRGGGGFRLASAMLTKRDEDRPFLGAAFMEQANTGMVGHEALAPLSTITGRGTQQRLVVGQLTHAYTSNTAGGQGDPSEPVKTITAGGNHHYVLQHELRTPFADHGEELRAFLVKYYGTADAADLADPLHSVTSRARFGLVIVGGQIYQIGDIGMRMLTPDELRGAQGFPKGYVTGWDCYDRKVTKTDEILLIGNSVSPLGAAPLIAANLPTAEPERAAA